ncbi:MAG: rhodanese-like domain-containing protein [Polyangia bacterium]
MRLVVILLVLSSVARADVTLLDEVRAHKAIAEGATVLDARDASDYRAGHLPHAVRIDWKDFRDGWGRTGRVSDDDGKLAKKLSALGVDDARQVIVYGKGKAGFGEEGRVAWMLAYLGHPRVALLDGGYVGWHGDKGWDENIVAGRFTVHRDAKLRADLDTVIRAVHEHDPILDIRTDEEWHGARKYYEARGGHLPGAKLVPFTSLFDASGKLDRVALVEKLKALSIPRDRPVYVYCTGGVRSALATVVLRALGYDAKNFDASFWAWAARSDLPVER